MTRTMINPQWLELLLSNTNFNGPKDGRVIDIRLYERIYVLETVATVLERIRQRLVASLLESTESHLYRN